MAAQETPASTRAAVDVLAVMDDHIRVHGRNGCPQHQRELLDVRNAVAELVGAADRLERKTVEQARLTSSVFNSDVESLRAALARVKGGAK